MQHTDKYNFNLIEMSDTFSPDPLNENMEKVEAALEANAAQHAFVKLGTVEVPANTMGGVTVTDPGAYTLLVADLNVKNVSSQDCHVSVNGDTSYPMYPGGNSRMHAIVLLFPWGDYVGGLLFFVSQTSPKPVDDFLAKSFGWTGVRTVGIRDCGSDTTVTLYGIKA